jgi:hypothetical protein
VTTKGKTLRASLVPVLYRLENWKAVAPLANWKVGLANGFRPLISS